MVLYFSSQEIVQNKHARVAELADALDSGSSERKFIGVQVPSLAPNEALPGKNWKGLFCVQEGAGGTNGIRVG